MSKKLLIGTSLSLCLSDLTDGTVKVEDVDLILASSKHPDLESAVASEEKWRAPPKRIEVLRAIWPRVIQPRLLHPECNGHLTRPWWIKADSLAEAFRMLDARDPEKVDNYEKLGFVAWADILLSTRIPVPIKAEYAHIVTPHVVDPESLGRIKHGLAKLLMWNPPETPASPFSDLEKQ